MLDALELNLTARVLLMAHSYGIVERERAAVLARAVIEVIHSRYPHQLPSMRELEPLIVDQLEMLEMALRGAAPSAHWFDPLDLVGDDKPDHTVTGEGDVGDTPAGHRPARLSTQTEGAQARSYEEKLRDEREPIQQLLNVDCARLGLVSRERAAELIDSLVGRPPEEAEQSILAELQQNLLGLLHKLMRKHRDSGPWASPRAREELRQDVQSTRSIKALLLLAQRIGKERRKWEREHGSGILGLLQALQKKF